MGFRCVLTGLGTFSYHAELDRGMTENELVHVFRGVHDGAVMPDPAEADAYRWCSLDEMRREIRDTPQLFTVWFAKYINAEWPMALTPAA